LPDGDSFVGKNLMRWLGLFCFTLWSLHAMAAPKTSYAIAVHGGAGVYEPDKITPDKRAAYEAGLSEALRAAQVVLDKDGSAMDAVQAAIIVLEDNPNFNAGRGAVLTHDGEAELDASIMDGATLKAGAVAGVKTIKNPIGAARKVMDNSPHVMLAREGAEAFAREQGLEMVPNAYFITERRQDELLRAKSSTQAAKLLKLGTVGAVVRDRHGNIAAGTSTGGMTNKRWGRIGDSPIIGAGTYADNNSCAVSGTGWGEYFIRATVARSICALVEYKKMPLAKAVKTTLDHVKQLGGDGGVIAIDAKGHIVLDQNTPGMFRGFLREGGAIAVGIHAADMVAEPK
jgi:L-asparaginase / beta-aspartyl-peptidase